MGICKTLLHIQFQSFFTGSLDLLSNRETIVRLFYENDDNIHGVYHLCLAILLAGGRKSLTPEIPVYPIKDYFDIRGNEIFAKKQERQ